MNGLAKFLACSTLLAVSAPLALAEPLSGGVEVSGGASYTTSTMTFVSPFLSNKDTGALSALAGGKVSYLLGTVNYLGGISAPLEAFTITSANGDVLAFFDTFNAPTQTTDPAGNLDVTLNESGYYTINGGAAMLGNFSLNLAGNSRQGQTGVASFDGFGSVGSAFVGATPEPGTYLLMGTGLFGMAGLLRSRRKLQA